MKLPLVLPLFGSTAEAFYTPRLACFFKCCFLCYPTWCVVKKTLLKRRWEGRGSFSTPPAKTGLLISGICYFPDTRDFCKSKWINHFAPLRCLLIKTPKGGKQILNDALKHVEKKSIEPDRHAGLQRLFVVFGAKLKKTTTRKYEKVKNCLHLYESWGAFTRSHKLSDEKAESDSELLQSREKIKTQTS